MEKIDTQHRLKGKMPTTSASTIMVNIDSHN